jgi:NADH-quinone oxidoreductase subunit F
MSSLEFFRDEYVAHVEQGGCPFDPAASTLFAPSNATQGAGAKTR